MTPGALLATPPNQLTIYSEDRQWKAELKAFKNYAFFYANIGSQASVYHLEATRNVWGQRTQDWVSRPAAIRIDNKYSGPIASGIGLFEVSGDCNSDTCRQLESALGFFVLDIKVGPGGVTVDGRPAEAQLNIARVDAHISVNFAGREIVSGDVSAGSILTDNSIWG